MVNFNYSRETFEKIAIKNNCSITDNFNKIIRIKKLGDLGIRCPCEPDNKLRYCGSPYCMKEMKETGLCHCKLFERKD